jgi:hypothetical protein
VSVVPSVRLNSWRCPDVLVTAPTLAYMMEQCRSLKVFILGGLALDENTICVLGGYSKPGLEISLFCCTLTSAGASALSEVLKRNEGPTELDFCELDNVVLANGLRGNTSLKI